MLNTVIWVGGQMIGRVELSTNDVRLYSVLDTLVISGEEVFVVWCLALWLVCLCVMLYGPSC